MEKETTNKIKVFFDLEFTGLHKLTTAISIGLVAEDGREYYAEFTDFDKFQIDTFLKKEVLPKRILAEYDFERDYNADAETVLVKGDIDLVHDTMLNWFMKYEEQGVEMWGDLLSYDWVLFLNIFGNALALPKFIDYIPMDLCTALKLMGEDKDVDRNIFAYGEDAAKKMNENKHNSLHDAKTQLEVFKRLIDKVQKSTNKAEKVDDTISKYENQAKEVVSKTNNEPKKGRGRPKKEPIKKEIIKPNINDNFIPPTQDEINQSQEFDSPI